MLPSVAEILDFPELRCGEPVVRAGHENLGRPVAWVHVIEIIEIAGLLAGGELILTTGIALPAADDDLRAYVERLSRAGVAALIVELGQRFTELPEIVVATARRCGLPLISLGKVTRFVAVTQAVHAHILNAQLQDMVAADEAHRAFNALTVAGRKPQDVVDLAATMSGRPVIYESLAHHVLAFNSAGRDADVLLTDWEHRSRAARLSGEAGDGTVWTSAPVAAPQGDTWGRLIMVSDTDLSSRERMILERGATALVINRLTDRDRDQVLHETHQTLLTALTLSPELPREAAARAGALGVPLTGSVVVGMVLAVAGSADASPGRLRDVVLQCRATLRALGVVALVGSLDDRRVAVLMSGLANAPLDRAVEKVAAQVHAMIDAAGDGQLVIGVGETDDGAAGSQRTLREAAQIAASATGLTGRLVYRRADLRLRSLVFALRQDPIVQGYVERELGRVLAYDAAHGATLFPFLVAYCGSGGNKTVAATRLFISRTALYDRIARVERILGVDLSDTETILALHFAIIAREAMTQPGLALAPNR